VSLKAIIARCVNSIALLVLVFFIAVVSQEFLSQYRTLASVFRSYPTLHQHMSMIIVSLILIMLFTNRNPKDYGIRFRVQLPIARVAIIGVLIGFLVGLTISLSGMAPENLPWEDMSVVQTILFIWILASIAEEVLFRGLIQGYLQPLKSIGVSIANRHISLPVIVGAVLFGLLHFSLLMMGVDFGFVSLLVFYAIILGLFAGHYAETTGSILPAIVIHTCFNIGGSFPAFFM